MVLIEHFVSFGCSLAQGKGYSLCIKLGSAAIANTNSGGQGGEASWGDRVLHTPFR